MKTISLSDFYSNIRKYIQIVLNGENIVISDNNKPVFYLEPIGEDKPKKKSPNIEAIDTICGKYREQLSSSRDFARRKQAEIKLEDKKWLKK